VVGLKPGVRRAVGAHLVITDQQVRLLADTTFHINPSADEITDIALLAADAATQLGIQAQVAMLSFSSFGSVSHDTSLKMSRAAAHVRALRPGLRVDGEMQADVALAAHRPRYPFCKLTEPANVLVFPNLDAGNIAYKMALANGGSDVIGPLMLGIASPVALLSPNDTVDSIVHLTTIAASNALGGAVQLAAE